MERFMEEYDIDEVTGEGSEMFEQMVKINSTGIKVEKDWNFF